MKIKFVVALSALTLSTSAFAACPQDKVAISKPGFYGAVNPDVYRDMDSAIQSKDKAKLSSLLSQRSVAEIPAGVKVCIVEVAFNWFRKQIEVPGLPGLYWVPDAAVTEVK